MPLVLTNKSRQLLIVRLNSGKSLHLAPQQSSGELPPIEISDNADIAKMSRRGLLGVNAPSGASSGAKSARSAASAAKRRSTTATP